MWLWPRGFLRALLSSKIEEGSIVELGAVVREMGSVSGAVGRGGGGGNVSG